MISVSFSSLLGNHESIVEFESLVASFPTSLIISVLVPILPSFLALLLPHEVVAPLLLLSYQVSILLSSTIPILTTLQF